MITRILFFLIVSSSLLAVPPTLDQWEFKIKGAGGMISHGVTWENGQVIKLDGGVPTAITLDKSAVGLSSAENIAISTYPGSTNWTTVGTITTGTWSATAIALGKVAQGGATSGQALTWNGSAWAPTTLTGSSVGLGNVENTALSTWAGTSNITTAGTITTGTWNATAIALGKIAQGGATSDQVLAWNGTAWTPTTIAVGITIGSTVITGGTSGRLLTSGSAVGELALGSGVSAALTTFNKSNVDNALSDDNFAFLGAAQTFTDVQTIKALRLGSTDGAYLRDGYEATGDVNQKGRLTWGQDNYNVSMQTNGAIATLSFMNAGVGYGSPYYSGIMAIPANHRFEFRSGTSATEVYVFNTYTSGTNFEAVGVFWSGNIAHYKPVAGAGGGTVQTQRFWLTGSVWIGSGSGTPEAVETAGVGSIYTDTATGDVYRKTSGTGNTGWVTP